MGSCDREHCETNNTEILLQYPEKALSIFLYTTLAMLAIGGNALVIFIVQHFHRMHTVTNLFIINLAVSDILMAILCIPFSYWPVLIASSWPFGIAMCKLISFSKVLAVLLSAHTLVLISIDKAHAFLTSLHTEPTVTKAMLFVGLVWLFDICIAAPILFVQSTVNHPSSTNQTIVYCTEEWGNDVGSVIYSSLIMLLQYFIPLAILIISYSCIGMKLMLSKSINEHLDPNSIRRRRQKNRKVVLMMFIVSSVYAVFWLPQNILNLRVSLCPGTTCHPYILYIWWGCHFTAMCQSALNPVIYAITSARFREGYSYVFQWIPCITYTPKELLPVNGASVLNSPFKPPTSSRRQPSLTVFHERDRYGEEVSFLSNPETLNHVTKSPSVNLQTPRQVRLLSFSFSAEPMTSKCLDLETSAEQL